MTTFLYKSRQPIILSDSLHHDGDLYIPINKLNEYTGLELKPEGVCTKDTCIPLNKQQEKEIIVHEKSLFNIVGFSRMMGEPVVHDLEKDVWVIGERQPDIQKSGTTLSAPDFTLPDFNGVKHTLSSYLGKKILLVSWASW
ncbi:peroxiredoxin family protein [Salirhabdus salicampi]|nr:peroxiredoxin family protein [Salirhabdus salicampi]